MRKDNADSAGHTKKTRAYRHTWILPITEQQFGVYWHSELDFNGRDFNNLLQMQLILFTVLLQKTTSS